MNDIDLKKESRSKFRETFSVPEELAGLAIGANGSNINKAKRVASVKCEKSPSLGLRFEVSGESKEAVKKARAMLEMCRDTFRIPKEHAGKMIGRFGENMQDIVTKSGVNRINMTNQEHTVNLEIIGSSKEVEKAIEFLQRQLDEKQGPKITIYRQPCQKFGFTLAGGKECVPDKDDDEIAVKSKGSCLKGIYVCKVEDGSTATAAGLLVGDKLLSVNGTDVVHCYRCDVTDFIQSFNCIDLLVDREDKKIQQVSFCFTCSNCKEDNLVRNRNRDNYFCPRYLRQNGFCPLLKCINCEQERALAKEWKMKREREVERARKMEQEREMAKGWKTKRERAMEKARKMEHGRVIEREKIFKQDGQEKAHKERSNEKINTGICDQETSVPCLKNKTVPKTLNISDDWEDYEEKVTKMPTAIKKFYQANKNIEEGGLGYNIGFCKGSEQRNKQRKFCVTVDGRKIPNIVVGRYHRY